MQNAYFPIIFDLGKKEPDVQPDEPTALASLTEQDWQLLAEQSQLVTYQQGDVILEKGVASDKIYIIENGQVCIERKAGDVIARRGRGAVFGEISFVEGKGTSANVVADGTVEVSVIEKAHVEAALATNPDLAIRFYKTLAITLAFRLRQAAERLNELS
jgi:CRP-like cAMP-binding protein